MYDRKTWIVVIACSLLLAVNITLQQRNARDLAERKKQEAAAAGTTSTATPDALAPAAAAGQTKPGSLVPVDPPTQLVEQVETLETAETVFTFTSIGGGTDQIADDSLSPAEILAAQAAQRETDARRQAA